MFSKVIAVPYWCGVDVTDESGLVRRGMICHKAPGGLFVNFGYSGHKNEFVPFDQCASHRVTGYAHYRIGDTVEALYRSASDQPWRWYPAKILAGSWERFAFVALNIGETVVEKVVPVDAVRRVHVLKLSGSDILRYYFEHVLELPKSGNLGKLTSALIKEFGQAGFLKIWNRASYTMAMKLEGGRLFYSSDMEESLIIIEPEVLKRILTRMAKSLPSVAVSSVSRPGGAVYPDSMDIHQCHVAMNTWTTAQLPLNIVDELFSFLSPVHRVACRKVCHLWNSLLTASASTYPVELDITHLGHLHRTLEYEWLARRLHESVTKSTRVLILSGPSVQHSLKIQHLLTVKTLLKAMNISVRFIVLSGIWVQACDLLDSWYSTDWDIPSDIAYCPRWREVCGTLILNNVAVGLPSAETVSVMVKKEVLNMPVEVGVENVLERWCPEVSGTEMEVLEGKLRAVWGRNEYYREDLWTLLSQYQPADKRFGPHVDEHITPIPAGTLGAPALRSLRRLTVWAMTRYNRIPKDNFVGPV